jgi:FAD binding domain
MATRFTAEQILDAMRVPTHAAWDVYQVGCSSSPLNFASQQIRAFLLTRALGEQNKIAGKEVAVIGAGLAGLTAAISCLYRGARHVALYDRNHDLMALQRGTTHRYVHPYIYRWPKADAEVSETDFPVLNWTEGTADAIRRQLIDELHRLFVHYFNTWLDDAKKRIKRGKKHKKNSEGRLLADRIRKAATALRPFDVDMELASEFLHYRLGTTVRNVNSNGGRLVLQVEGRKTAFEKDRNEYLPIGPYGPHQDTCDLVIAAVGFGLERETTGVPFKSYWQQDTLSQSTIREPYPRRWLVMGTGDGGLIEAVRLRLFDSDQKLLTDILTGLQSPPIRKAPTRERWGELVGELRIDLETVDERIRKKLGFDRLTAEATNAPDIRNRVSEELFKSYVAIQNERKEVFALLKAFIRNRQRTDTDVVLSGRIEQPFEFGASPFQRFLVYLIMRFGGLRYRQGTPKLVSAPATAGASYRYAFVRGDAPDSPLPADQLEFDEVVVRHGAVATLDTLFGAETKELAKKSQLLAKLDEAIRDDELPDDWRDWPPTPVIPKWKPK